MYLGWWGGMLRIPTAIVALRGTEYWQDWVSDLDIPLVPDRSVPSAGMVHMGFQLVYEHIRDSILALLGQECMGATKIYVTGHSLGGALAVLCGMDLVSNSPVKVVPELHTFAGPRVGDSRFAGSFAGKVPVCFRVVNFMDVVPQVPLPPAFEHVGTEILVHGGFKPLDPVYAHHLTTYKAAGVGIRIVLPDGPTTRGAGTSYRLSGRGDVSGLGPNVVRHVGQLMVFILRLMKSMRR